MEANGAKPINKNGNFNMTDYKKLERSSLLSKYSVVFPHWRQRNAVTKEPEFVKKEFKPFKSFDTTIGKAPDW